MTAADNEPRWKKRFRAPRSSLPHWAFDAPHRCIYTSNVSGTFEIYAWDRHVDTHRQVTERPTGTSDAAIDPSGEWIWWFADTDGDEFGTWMRQPFGGGADQEAATGLPPAYSSGLALGRDGSAVIGISSEGRTTVWVSRRDGLPYRVYEHVEQAYVGGVSSDGRLLSIAHSEHGDYRHPALRVITAGGDVVDDLWHGPGLGLQPIGFSPVGGDGRLLALHERRGRRMPLVWDALTGAQQDPDLELPGEVTADWYPDGTALLVRHEHRGRSELYRYHLERERLERLPTPRGEISDATARPDGSVEFLWSSAAEPPQVRSIDGTVVLTVGDEPAPPSVPVEDAEVDGPGGRVHALVSRPAGAAPYPAVFLVHGGPTWHDSDAFSPEVAAWVDAGFAVVQVNYRGSTGYGTAWRDALEGRVGLTELEDLAAVRSWAVESGLVDPARLVLAGNSWGGFLTLLGLGTQPELWSLGVAGVPVADYVAAYEDEMEALQAFDRALFGGTPDDVPDSYRQSSPLTYVDNLRVPVLVLAGANDPRCPIRQIENYLARLAERGMPHEVYRFDAGHGSLVVEEKIRQVETQLDFARRHLRTAPSPS